MTGLTAGGRKSGHVRRERGEHITGSMRTESLPVRSGRLSSLEPHSPRPDVNLVGIPTRPTPHLKIDLKDEPGTICVLKRHFLKLHREPSRRGNAPTARSAVSAMLL